MESVPSDEVRILAIAPEAPSGSSAMVGTLAGWQSHIRDRRMRQGQWHGRSVCTVHPISDRDLAPFPRCYHAPSETVGSNPGLASIAPQVPQGPGLTSIPD